VTPPTAQEQVAFLGNLQRLLAEGGFVATYKNALLIALADLSVELGDDSGDALTVPVSAIAEKFLAYYWRQAMPYPGREGATGILKQNTGRQAAVIRLVGLARAEVNGSLVAAKARPALWKGLVKEVSAVVKTMPLWKLQRVGDEVLEFLYPMWAEGTRSSCVPASPSASGAFTGSWTNWCAGPRSGSSVAWERISGWLAMSPTWTSSSLGPSGPTSRRSGQS
jgi:hypothetical protein